MLALSSGTFRPNATRGGFGEEDLFLIFSAMADGDSVAERLRLWPRVVPIRVDVGVGDQVLIGSGMFCVGVSEKTEPRGVAGGVASLLDFLNNLPKIWFRLGGKTAG
jgi:hypothetical protein